MKKVLQRIILLLLLFNGYHANAQIKFSASVTPAEIGKDEYTQLKLMVENASEVQQIVPPNLRDFVVISGPSQESGMTMINGVVKRYIALSFILKPKAAGTFTIMPAKARADAGDYTSNAVKVKVSSQSTGNNPAANVFSNPFGGMDPFADPAPQSSYSDIVLRKGENPADKIKRNMFVRVETDKKSAYVGEPLIATYKLYTRLKSESNMIKNPSFNGFSVLDMQLPGDMSYHTEKFEGREYNVYIIRKVQLYPLLAGNLDLGVAEIENNVQFIKAAYLNQQADVFDDFANAALPSDAIEIQKVTLQSKPVSISIKPLPEAGKPDNFKGAVGSFSVEAKVEKNNFTTDDDGKMAILVSGEGNLQMINAPEIAWPAGIDGFEPKAIDDFFKSTVPVSGKKVFEFPFTVSKPGTYIIPAIGFSYFDNHDAKYKTVATRAIEITVSKGTGKTRTLPSANKKNRENVLTQFFSNRLRVVSVVALLIVIGLIVWLKRDTKNEARQTSKQPIEENEIFEKPVEATMEEQRNPLELSQQSLNGKDTGLFYAQLNLELKNYLARKLGLRPEELNRKNITEKMDARAISNETAIALQKLMDELEWQLYTPVADNEKMKQMYDRANELIQELNTYRS